MEEYKKLFDMITEGDFRGVHAENNGAYNEYCRLVTEMAENRVAVGEGLIEQPAVADKINMLDCYALGIKKLEKFASIKNKNVDFDKLMVEGRNDLFQKLWSYHRYCIVLYYIVLYCIVWYFRWGQYNNRNKEKYSMDLEEEDNIRQQRRKANIIVNMKLGTHLMNKRNQFIVESLDKALRIAKDGDEIFLEKGKYESSTCKMKNGKTFYDFHKNLTITGAAVHDVIIISSIFRNTG